MANPSIDALTLLIEEEIANVNFRPFVMLSRILKRDAYQTQVKWDVNVGGAQVQGRATTADATVGNTDAVRGASLAIGDRVLGHAFSVRRNDITQARRTAPGALRELFAAHILTAFDVIMPALNQVLYTGTGNAASHGVFGLDYVLTNANTYAGLDPATYTDWTCVNLANAGTGRNLTKSLISSTDVALQRKGVAWDAIVTTPEMVEVYGSLFSSDRSLTTVQVNGQADIGFSGYSYKGKPIISDPHCPNGKLYFVDSSMLQLYTYALTDSVDAEQSKMADTQKTSGLNFLVAQLPSNNPHAIRYEISVQPQLKAHNRKCVGVLADINQ